MKDAIFSMLCIEGEKPLFMCGVLKNHVDYAKKLSKESGKRVVLISSPKQLPYNITTQLIDNI